MVGGAGVGPKSSPGHIGDRGGPDLLGGRGDYTGDTDCKAILASAAAGLDWFAKAKARWHLTGRTVDNLPVLSDSNDAPFHDRYHAEDGMCVNHLFGAGQRIRNALPHLDDAMKGQHVAVSALAGNWQGNAGMQAQDKLNDLAKWSGAAATDIKSLPDTIFAAVDAVKRAVERKADAFRRLAGVNTVCDVDMTNGNSVGGGGIRHQ